MRRPAYERCHQGSSQRYVSRHALGERCLQGIGSAVVSVVIQVVHLRSAEVGGGRVELRVADVRGVRDEEEAATGDLFAVGQITPDSSLPTPVHWSMCDSDVKRREGVAYHAIQSCAVREEVGDVLPRAVDDLAIVPAGTRVGRVGVGGLRGAVSLTPADRVR